MCAPHWEARKNNLIMEANRKICVQRKTGDMDVFFLLKRFGQTFCCPIGACT
jgi:hypothetical protein